MARCENERFGLSCQSGRLESTQPQNVHHSVRRRCLATLGHERESSESIHLRQCQRRGASLLRLVEILSVVGGNCRERLHRQGLGPPELLPATFRERGSRTGREENSILALASDANCQRQLRQYN